jgi:hypothetical protein
MACAIALPAGAAPKRCDTKPTAPGCEAPVDDEPLAGSTCNAIGEWRDPVNNDFTVTLTENACIDVIATAGNWIVEIDENPEGTDGTLRWLGLVIRDSIAPGDACDSVSYRKDIPTQITLDGFESDDNPGIAGAWVNSCGTDWAEWVGDVYHAAEDINITSPLVLQVFMSGKDAAVTLTIDLP